jgi:uncharacterized membrane protein
MLKYFIQVIESFSASALLTALLWALIVKGGVMVRKKRFIRGCAAGCAASLVLAVLKRTTPFINRTIINGWTLSFAMLAGMGALIFLFVPKTPGPDARDKTPKTGRRARAILLALDAGTMPLLGALLLFYALSTVFLYPAEFLLAGDTIFTVDFLFKCLGYAGGIIVVLVSALAVSKNGIDAPPVLLRIVFTSGLIVTMLNQAALFIQFLFARRIIKIIPWIFSIIAPALNHSAVFLYALIALMLILPGTLFIRSFAKTAAPVNPAEGRKFKARSRGLRRWALFASGGLAVAVAGAALLKPLTQRTVVLSPAEPMTLAGSEIIIPLTQIEDGHLHRFAYTAGENIEVRFIVIKKNEAAFGVGLDACEICGATGYYERKNEVICRLCDVVMNKSTIGFRGGCNPVPLAYALRSGSMVIQTSDLENERTRFK